MDRTFLHQSWPPGDCTRLRYDLMPLTSRTARIVFASGNGSYAAKISQIEPQSRHENIINETWTCADGWFFGFVSVRRARRRRGNYFLNTICFPLESCDFQYQKVVLRKVKWFSEHPIRCFAQEHKTHNILGKRNPKLHISITLSTVHNNMLPNNLWALPLDTILNCGH